MYLRVSHMEICGHDVRPAPELFDIPDKLLSQFPFVWARPAHADAPKC